MKRNFPLTMTKRSSVKSLIRLGIFAAILACLFFSGVPLKPVRAQPVADLAIYKTAEPEVAIAGEYLIYTITVVNNGLNGSVALVNVTDYLPTTVQYVAHTGGGSFSGGNINVTLSDIHPGESKSFLVKVLVPADYIVIHGHTPINNTVQMTGVVGDSDPRSGNNVFTLETLVQSQADLKVTKICKPDTTVQVGKFINYTIIVENWGPSMATNVKVTDEIRSSGTFTVLSITAPGYTFAPTPPVTGQSIALVGTRNLNMDVGARDIIEMALRGGSVSGFVGEAQDINNLVIVESAEPDPDLSNNQAEKSINVEAVADLEMGAPATTPGKTDSSDPVYTGQSFVYTLAVTNVGPSTAVNVLVKDWVPAGLSINNATSSAGEWNIGVPGDPLRPTTFTLDSMPSGRSDIMTINVTVLDPADPSLKTWILHNDAMVSSDTFDPDNSNNLATEDTTIINSLVKETADLNVVKIVKPDTTVLAGQTINCTIIVENLGSHYALNVSIRDEILSSGIFELVDCILDSDLIDEGPFYPPSPPGGMTLEFNLNEPLAPKNITNKGRWVIQILLRANETQDINDVVNVFTRDLNGFISVDPDLSNNEAQCSIHVTAVADLEITKTDTPDPVVTNRPATLNYTLVVTNHGPSTAMNVLVRDWLPTGVLAGASVKNVTPSIGSCLVGVPGDFSRPTTWAIGFLEPGASASLLITMAFPISPYRHEAELLRNEAIVSSDTFDPDNSNNYASTDTRVGRSPPLYASAPTWNWPPTLVAIQLISSMSLVGIVVAISIKKKINYRLIARQLIGLLKAKKRMN